MKRWLALLLALVMVFAMAACGKTEEKEPPQGEKTVQKPDVPKPEETPEDPIQGGKETTDEIEDPDTQDMAERFVDSLFTPYIQATVDMLPMEPLLKHADPEDAKAFEKELDSLVDESQESMEDYVDQYDSLRWETEVVSEEKATEEELEALREYYKESNLEPKAAVKMEVEVVATADGEKERAYFDLICVYIDGEWYLDVSCLDALSEIEGETLVSAPDVQAMAEEVISSMLEADMEGIIKQMHPDVLEMFKETYGDEYDAIIEEGNAMLEEEIAAMGGYDLDYEVKVTEIEQIAEDIELIQSNYTDAGMDIEIEDAYQFDVSVIFEGEEEEAGTLAVILVDNEWYLDISSMGELG